MTLDSDNGDNWATYYKFTVQHGTPEEVAKIEKRVEDAEPKHGLIWPGVAKAPENQREKIISILKKTAATIL